jgi:WD40 repeat protein/serine/threonine protein kinase/Tfp pilus assembly protein PilF
MNAVLLSSLGDLLTPQGHPAPDHGVVLSIFQQVVVAVGELHASGKVHRTIRRDRLQVLAGGAVSLAPAPEAVELDRGDPESCPPELTGAGSLVLPASLDEARQVLASHALPIDPRRIDVYQLGVLLANLCTGDSVSRYLRSPVTRGQVPAALRPVLDRALGFQPNQRLADADALLAELEAVRPADLAPPCAEAGDTPAEGIPGLPFTHLGQYQIVGVVGHGGMGEVYLGYEEGLRRQVAIKVLPPLLARNPSLVERFRQEAGAAGQLSHPNVVPIYFIGEEDGRHYFVMKYVEGESLEQRLDRFGRLPVPEVVDLLEQALLGLQAAHAAGLIHRDLKPANLLWERKTGRVLLTDFGLVKVDRGPGLTSSGVLLGTVEYMAPEQTRGKMLDCRADLYSLGVLTYRMLAGQLPFSASSPTALLFQHAYAVPEPLTRYAPDLPADLVKLVEGLLRKSPADRYADCSEVLAELRRLQAGEPLRGPRGSAPSAAVCLPSLPSLPAAPVVPAGWRMRVHGWLLPRRLLARQTTTMLEIDAALEQYRQRKEQLAGLLAEGQATADDLAAQAAGYRLAADTARQHPTAGVEVEQALGLAESLEVEAEQQRRHLEPIRAELIAVEETLARLTGQRDLLQARLKHFPQRAMHPRRRLPLWVGGIVILLLAVWLLGRPAPRTEIPPAPTSLSPAAAPLPPGLVQSFSGHNGDVWFVTVSPDGRYLLSGSQTGELFLWNRETGQLVRRFVGHENAVHSGVFSPDSRRVLSSACDQTVRVWDVETGRLEHTLREHRNWVSRVVLSPDSRRALSGGWDGLLCLWDLDSGKLLTSIPGHTAPIEGLAFLPDGKRALSTSQDHTLRLWDLERRAEVYRASAPVAQLALFPNGGWALTGGRDNVLRLWSVETGQELTRLKGHSMFACTVAITPDGRRALSGSHDKSVRVWDLVTGKTLHTFTGHTGEVWRVAVTPDGSQAASASADGTVRLWRLPAAPPRSAAHLPGQAHFALGEWDQAEAAFAEAIRSTPTPLDHQWYGLLLRRKGDRAGATGAFRKANAASQPLTEDAEFCGSVAADRDLPNAVAAWEMARLHAPDDPFLLLTLGLLHGQLAYLFPVGSAERKGSFEAARKSLQRADELGRGRSDWSYPSAWWLCNYAMLLGEHELAVQAGQRADNEAKGFEAGHAHLGWGLFALARWEEAEKELRRARELTADRTLKQYLAYNLALLARRRGDTAIASQLFREAANRPVVRPDEEDDLFCAFLGQPGIQGGPGWVQILDRALRMAPGEATLWLTLGKLHARLGQKEKAIEAFRKAEELGRKLPAWPYPTAAWAEALSLATRPATITCLAVGAEGRPILLGDVNGLLRVLATANTKQLGPHNGQVLAVALSPSGPVSSDGDRNLRSWDLESGRVRWQVRLPEPAWGLALSRNGKFAVCTLEGRGLGVLSLPPGKSPELRILEGAWANTVAQSGDDRWAFTGGKDGAVALWDLQQGKMIREFRGHRGWVRAVALSADGTLALSGSGTAPIGSRTLTEDNDSIAILWDVASGTIRHRLVGHTSTVTCVAISPDGRVAVTGSNDGTVRLWDVTKGTLLRQFSYGAPVWALTIPSTGQYVVVGGDGGTLRRFPLGQGR